MRKVFCCLPGIDGLTDLGLPANDPELEEILSDLILEDPEKFEDTDWEEIF